MPKSTPPASSVPNENSTSGRTVMRSRRPSMPPAAGSSAPAASAPEKPSAVRNRCTTSEAYSVPSRWGAPHSTDTAGHRGASASISVLTRIGQNSTVPAQSEASCRPAAVSSVRMA